MNIRHEYLDDATADLAMERTRDTRRVLASAARPTKFGRHYGQRPQQHNGMHRRRRKKLRW